MNKAVETLKRELDRLENMNNAKECTRLNLVSEIAEINSAISMIKAALVKLQ